MTLTNKKLEAYRAIGLTIAITLVYQIVSSLPSLISGGSAGNELLSWHIAVSQVVFMFFPAIIFGYYSKIELFEVLRLNNSPSIRQYIFGFFGIISIIFISAGWVVVQESLIPEEYMIVYKAIAESIEESYKMLLLGEGSVAFFKALFIGAFLPAVCEEVLFRGYLQRTLEEAFSPAVAILLSGGLFGAIHFNPIGILPLMLIGIFLSLSAYFSKSITLPIMLHFLNNAVVISALYSGSAHTNDITAPEQYLTPVSALIITLAGLIFAVLSGYGIFKHPKKTNYNNE